MMSNQSTQKQNATDRDRIRQADPISHLIAVMQGDPLPVRDLDGNVLSFERPDVNVRVAAASKLLERIVPALKSVEIAAGDGGVTFRIAAPFAPPGSARQHLEAAATPRDLEASLRQIENAQDTTAAPAARAEEPAA